MISKEDSLNKDNCSAAKESLRGLNISDEEYSLSKAREVITSLLQTCQSWIKKELESGSDDVVFNFLDPKMESDIPSDVLDYLDHYVEKQLCDIPSIQSAGAMEIHKHNTYKIYDLLLDISTDLTVERCKEYLPLENISIPQETQDPVDRSMPKFIGIDSHSTSPEAARTPPSEIPSLEKAGDSAKDSSEKLVIPSEVPCTSREKENFSPVEKRPLSLLSFWFKHPSSHHDTNYYGQTSSEEYSENSRDTPVSDTRSTPSTGSEFLLNYYENGVFSMDSDNDSLASSHNSGYTSGDDSFTELGGNFTLFKMDPEPQTMDRDGNASQFVSM